MFKKGDKVKLSEVGLQYLYPGEGNVAKRRYAAGIRGEVCSIENRWGGVTIKRLDTPKHSHNYYHITFLELIEARGGQ
uniref:Uncharacterized protein n=1 Tax=viral metagenome TaxID=1070528 RepID=A0A6M3LUE5_9ZZZZ